MQHDHPLTLQHVLQRMRTMNGHEEVVTLTEGEPDDWAIDRNGVDDVAGGTTAEVLVTFRPTEQHGTAVILPDPVRQARRDDEVVRESARSP